MKTTCLAYNTTVQTSTGQTLFFAMFGWEATLPVNWIYPLPEVYMEMDRLDRNDARKVSESLCWYERETTSHSMSECSNVQIDCVKVQSWRVGLGFLSKDYT